MKLFTDKFNSNPTRIPAEWEPHSSCWMAWAVHPEWLGWVDEVKSELAEVICTIAKFETVRLLTPPHELADAKARFAGGNVEIIEAPVDDIWMRDIAPTFALRSNKVVAIDWNFNSWGSTKERPVRPGDHLAKFAEDVFSVPRISMPFVADAGAIVTDGSGTLITTRSCLLNPNRNPKHVAEEEIEREFAKLGIHRTIWLKGDPDEPMTSGHVDGYVLFKAQSSVLVEIIDDRQVEPPVWHSRDIETLEQAKDAAERTFNVERIKAVPAQKPIRSGGRFGDRD